MACDSFQKQNKSDSFVRFIDARVKSLKPRCACTRVVLWLNDPPQYGAEHPVDVRFAPTEAERRHKSGA